MEILWSLHRTVPWEVLFVVLCLSFPQMTNLLSQMIEILLQITLILLKMTLPRDQRHPMVCYSGLQITVTKPPQQLNIMIISESIMVVRNCYNKHAKSLLWQILTATIKWSETVNSFIVVFKPPQDIPPQQLSF